MSTRTLVLRAWFMASALSCPLYCATAHAQCIEQVLVGSQTSRLSEFGYSIDVEGDVAVIGSRQWGAGVAGAAFVFGRDPVTRVWSERQRIEPTVPEIRGYFGYSVALAGEWIAVGSPAARGTHGQPSGAVEIFRWNPSSATWVFFERLMPELIESIHTGLSVDLAGDVLVFGGVGEAWDGSGPPSGRAWIYRFDPSAQSWRLELDRSGVVVLPSQSYGSSVATDGSRVLVGAPGFGFYGPEAPGAVDALRYDSSSGSWLDEVLDTPAGLALDARFGTAVDLDGNTAVVGGRATWIFERTPGGWSLEDAIQPDFGAPAYFGWDVAIAGDSILSGLLLAGNPSGGAAYLITREPVSGRWIETLWAEGTQGGFFGNALALDAETSMVGAPYAPYPGAREGRVSAWDRRGCSALGTPICTPQVPNSTGVAGAALAVGSPFAGGQPLTLHAFDLPLNQMGYLLCGSMPAATPQPGGSQGVLCVGGQLGRFTAQVGNSGVAGILTVPVDTLALPTSPPATVMAGQRWTFQFWYRDANPAPTSNFTHALTLLFQ